MLHFPLGRSYHGVMEKTGGRWQLRVLQHGATVLTHPIDEPLAARLLSARGIPAEPKVARIGRRTTRGAGAR